MDDRLMLNYLMARQLFRDGHAWEDYGRRRARREVPLRVLVFYGGVHFIYAVRFVYRALRGLFWAIVHKKAALKYQRYIL
jgi:hypothetical protein